MANSPSSLLRWTLQQVWRFIYVLLELLFLGVILAMARRQFSFKAWLVGLSIMLVGIFASAAALYEEHTLYHGAKANLLWAGILLATTLGGFAIAKVGRRVGFWEIHLACAIVVTLSLVQLLRGWHYVLGIVQEPTTTFAFLMPSPPGVTYLGPLWDRVFVIVAISGFLLAVFGGSLGYLLYSATGKRDASFGFEWFVSRHHLGAEGRGGVSLTALVAVVGIALGVAALVCVTAVMSGYQEDIQTKILSTNAHLVVQKYGIDFSEYNTIAEKGMAVPGVTAAAPYTFNEAMLSDGDRGIGVLIKGIDATASAKVTKIAHNLCTPRPEGTCLPLEGTDYAQHLAELLKPTKGVPSMVVGYELFKRMGSPLGSSVVLTTPIGIAGARGNAPKRMEFVLTGAFRSGMHEFDARLAYLDLDASQTLMGMGKNVSGVEFRVQDPEQVEEIGKKVLRAVGRYPYRSLDWRELNQGIFMALNLQKIAMFIILTFIVIVAAFNIASTLFMAVVEKAREIALLKSVGARDASIMKIFVLQGWLVGGVGTVLGVAMGLLMCLLLSRLSISIAADVYMVESLSVRVWPTEVLLTTVAALVISHLATLYPALKAARQRPVDAMRYE